MTNSRNNIDAPPGEKPEKESDPDLPGRNTPVKPDQNPDPTMPIPGGNEPEKNDPTRIKEPPSKLLGVSGSIGALS